MQLFVSSGPEQVAVPDVTGLSRDSAEDSLRAERASNRRSARGVRDSPTDEVISQDPSAGTEVDARPQGHDHGLQGVPSRSRAGRDGPAPERCRAQLRAAGTPAPSASARHVTDPSQDGVVIDQRPAAGDEVDKGTQVVIFVGALRADRSSTPRDGRAPP